MWRKDSQRTLSAYSPKRYWPNHRATRMPVKGRMRVACGNLPKMARPRQTTTMRRDAEPTCIWAVKYQDCPSE